MPKKFRRISLILALALIVSALFPGVNVQAATMSLSKTTIRLYVGGDSLTNYGKTYTLSVKNKNSAYSVSYKSSKTSVVTVGKTTGKITAKGAGKATITATVKSGTKTVKTLKATVYVYRHASSIALNASLAKTLKRGITVGTTKSGKIGYRKASGKTAWKSDATYITDTLRYKSSNTSVFKVDAKSGKITAVGEGDATLTIYAVDYSGKKKVTKLGEKKYPVKVVSKQEPKATATPAPKATSTPTPTPLQAATPEPTATSTPTPTPTPEWGKIVLADQTGISDFSLIRLTFSTEKDAKAVLDNPSLLQVTRTNSDGENAGVTQVYQSNVFKSIKATNDPCAIILGVYDNLYKGITYEYTYRKSSVKFTGVGNEVASVRTNPYLTVKPETEVEIPYTLYNKNGVDITQTSIDQTWQSTGDAPPLLALECLAEDNGNGYTISVEPDYKGKNPYKIKLYFYEGNKNVEATIKAIVGYDSKGDEIAYTDKIICSSTTITSSQSGFTYAIGEVGAPAASQAYSGGTLKISTEVNTTKQLFVKYSRSIGKYTTNYYIPEYGEYYLTSNGNDIVVVTKEGVLVPVAPGKTNIVIRDIVTGDAISYIPIEVTDASQIQGISISPLNDTIVMSKDSFTKRISVNAVDQFGKSMNIDNASYAVIQGRNDDFTIKFDSDYKGITVISKGTYNGEKFDDNRTFKIRFDFSSNGKSFSQTYTLVMRNTVDPGLSHYKMLLSSTGLNADLTSKTQITNATIQLQPLDPSGANYGSTVPINVVSSKSAISTTDNSFSILVTGPDGNVFTEGLSGSGSTTINFSCIIGNGDGTIRKIAPGVYTINIYRGDGTSYAPVAYNEVSVNKGEEISIEVKNGYHINSYEELKDIFYAYRGPVDVTSNLVSVVPVDPKVNGKEVEVKRVIIKEKTTKGIIVTDYPLDRTFILNQ